MSDEAILTLNERVTRLVRHLRLAGEHGRAAILLVVYRSEFVRVEAEQRLLAELAEMGEEVVKVRVAADQPPADIPTYLAQHPASGRAIFLIYDVGQGGSDTLQFLNYRRELLVESQQRLVLWLTEGEFAEVARQAPDFFSFRGRSLEFLETPERASLKKLVTQFAYYDWNGNGQQTHEEREVGIRLRENLLAELPLTPEFAQQRAELLYALSGEYWQQGQFERALQIALEVNKLVASNRFTNQLRKFLYSGSNLQTRLQNLLGNLYLELKRYEEAIASYKQAIKLNPKYATPYNGLGHAYRMLGRYEESITVYKKAISIDPQYASPYNGLGIVYSDLGQYEDAISAYKQALTLNPQDANFYFNLGSAYQNLGWYDKAIANYQRAISFNPQNSAMYTSLGLTHFASSHIHDAISNFQQAIVYNPDNTIAHMSLASCYREIGKETEYQKHIEIARSLIAKENEYNRACFEAIADNHEEALTLLAQAFIKGQASHHWAQQDPDLASLRQDPRFQALVHGSS